MAATPAAHPADTITSGPTTAWLLCSIFHLQRGPLRSAQASVRAQGHACGSRGAATSLPVPALRARTPAGHALSPQCARLPCGAAARRPCALRLSWLDSIASPTIARPSRIGGLVVQRAVAGVDNLVCWRERYKMPLAATTELIAACRTPTGKAHRARVQNAPRVAHDSRPPTQRHRAPRRPPAFTTHARPGPRPAPSHVQGLRVSAPL